MKLKSEGLPQTDRPEWVLTGER